MAGASGELALLADAFVPAAAPPSDWADDERAGVVVRAARWTPDGLARLAAHLDTRGAAALAALPDNRLLAAWAGAVAAFRDPDSPERRRLDPALARLCRLSPAGLAAGLEAVLGGVSDESAGRVLQAAHALPAPPRSPVLVILASNLPALAVQPLLPALALRRPVILKSPTAEPLFAPAFAAALAAREPALGEAVAALTWPGGDAAREAPLLAAAGRVVAYGEQPTLDDLARRALGRLLGYGPKTSLAVVSAGGDLRVVAAGLARDVALFDQRGCLSVAAVYAGDTAGDAESLAAALAAELADLAAAWPPGPPDLAAAAAVRQLREEAALRGLLRWEAAPHAAHAANTGLAAGTVVVDPDPTFRPTPGLRTVRVHPLPDLARLPDLLAPWRGRLQGAALAGEEARALEPALRDLGLSRFARPGELQSPDAAWHNGGIDPLAALAER